MTKIDELKVAISAQNTALDSLSAQLAQKVSSMSDMRGKIESLEKDKQAAAQVNDDLRQQLQRALGYIDRVNECAGPVVDTRQVESIRERGPRLDGVMFNRSSGGASMDSEVNQYRRAPYGRY